MTLQVPFRVVKRGGRQEMQLPGGAAQPRRNDSALIKAMARAFRWKRMLEAGEFATIAPKGGSELEAEGPRSPSGPLAISRPSGLR